MNEKKVTEGNNTFHTWTSRPPLLFHSSKTQFQGFLLLKIMNCKYGIGVRKINATFTWSNAPKWTIPSSSPLQKHISENERV